MVDSGYGFLDRLLHKLTLQYRPIARMSFDLDQLMVKADSTAIRQHQHVFVAGLARAGTTVLMRRFYATGLYRSLTYRDMPFVLAPNFWKRLSLLSKRDIENVERAHGDTLLVNADSPESFDEVFWRIFAGDEYLHKTHLRPHKPCDEVISKYISYVSAILSEDSSSGKRYLSKNNNNILRLGAIHRAFPKALIIIPFREPLQHAFSLLRQHHRFSELQKKSKFTQSYMTWLGHHEFGLDHRPFQLGSIPNRSQYPTDNLNYWLQLWCETYEWLENLMLESALFLCYEDLCTDDGTWARLAALAGISANHRSGGDSFTLSRRSVNLPVDNDLANRATTMYSRLVTQSRSQLARAA